jgi:putative ABC transport system permease protein
MEFNATWALVLKSIFRNKSRSFMLGLLICFAAFVMAFFTQFLMGVSKNFTDNLVELASGDIYISSEIKDQRDHNIFDREYDYFRYSPEFYAELEKLDGFVGAHPRLDMAARIVTSQDSIDFALSAFNPAEEASLLKNFVIIEGRMIKPDAYEIIVPEDWARRHQIAPGNSVSVMSRSVDRRINLLSFTVVGTFKTNSLSAWFNNSVYTSIEPARVLVNDSQAVTRLNLRFANGFDKDKAIAKINSVMAAHIDIKNPTLNATYWQDGAEFFTSLVAGIEAGFFIVIGVICSILGACIALATVMGIMERSKEIATLGALGAAPKTIRKIFLMENVFLSDIASLLGISIAAVAFIITAKTGLPINNPELEGFLGASHFYPAYDVAGFIGAFLITKLVATNATFFIAGWAAKRSIADAMAE